MTEAEYQHLLVNSMNRSLSRKGIYLLKGQKRWWRGYGYCTDVEVEMDIESRFELAAILELKYGARCCVLQPSFYAYARRTPFFSIVDGLNQQPVRWRVNKVNSRIGVRETVRFHHRLIILQRAIEDFNFFQLPKLR